MDCRPYPAGPGTELASTLICSAKTAYLNLPGTQLARSEEVLEVRFHFHPAVDLENVAGHAGWIQLHVVSRSMPEVPLTAEQILCLVRSVLGYFQLAHRKCHEASLCVMWIAIAGSHDQCFEA